MNVEKVRANERSLPHTISHVKEVRCSIPPFNTESLTIIPLIKYQHETTWNTSISQLPEESTMAYTIERTHNIHKAYKNWRVNVR